MKPALLMIVTGSLLLTGCAGMKSEFDCDATASNSCMTMDEANNKARAVTENNTFRQQDTKTLPPLAESRVQPPGESLPFAVRTPADKTTVSVQPAYQASLSEKTEAVTNSRPVTFPVSQNPVRLQATIARMWIAAWTDEQDIWHQPSLVSFEVVPSRWAYQQEVKG